LTQGPVDLLIRGAACVLTMDGDTDADPLGSRAASSVGVRDGLVAWIGATDEAPEAREVVDAAGCVVLPGLVECHTHSVWAGSRSDEFRRRLSGVPYTTILEEGGGILSTVDATRCAGEAELVALAAGRLSRLASRGVTTIEIKSGYGLSPAYELRMLRAARAAGDVSGLRVLSTFLGAHAVPRSFRADRSAYVRQVIEEQLPQVAEAADFIDAYVDRGAFTVDEGHAILSAGKAAGLGVRVHAEQVAYTGAAAMAAGLGALSADHLEQLDEAGVEAMAQAGTVAVLLPGAQLYLRDPAPPVASLREAGVRMAVATDLNPGSSPVLDPWISATLSCVAMGLTVEEALLGITRNAALALGRPDLGRLYVGAPADVVVVSPPPGEAATPASLIQFMGGAQIRETLRGGSRLSFV